jgi:hypothetical protein
LFQSQVLPIAPPGQRDRYTSAIPMKLLAHIDGRFFCFAAIACILLSALHCGAFFERDTTIETDGKNPPTFTFSGNGQVSSIIVMDLSPSDVSIYDPRRRLWEIVPNGDRSPSEFPNITYGVLPPEFWQKVPTTGSPLPLQEEKPYQISAPTSNAGTRELIFLYRSGQSLRVERGADGSYYAQTPALK